MISISLCMIVKNEEAVLERCLSSFKPLVDEMVIVDTGSIDSTKKIAAHYTNRIFDFEWTGDFSEARNFAFSKCTCEYIYSADADEFIDEENAAEFLALKKAMEPEVELVQMWYVNRHPYRTTDNYERDLRPKLYKRLRSFVWIDPVHESVRLDPVVFDSDIEIIHMPGQIHAGRDFSIFLKSLASGESLSPKLMHMYSMELFMAGSSGDFYAAAPYFEAMIGDPSTTEDMRMDAYCVLAHCARIRRNTNAFFKWCLKNISIKPCAEICCELGHYYFDAGDTEEASVWFINALEETDAILIADAARRTPLDMLAHCYERLAAEHPEIKDVCLKMAVDYKAKLSEALKS
ncbi:MAG: glycosyltransferase family 2 protein [Lachnospiraceae bacterium]|nr:glycosyltransferase family 2 protein [Lachnospiraceae bacterium]